MTETTEQNAVIYARVSSTKQKTQGHGLDSQESRCRDYAAYKGMRVVGVYKDDISGAASKRPAMERMLTYLREHRAEPHAVIIDDISRLARDMTAHLQLRAEIAEAGGILASPSIEFGADSDSQLVEHLLASVSQHHRQKNAEQVKNRMRARTLAGYWCFQAPVGYRYEKVAGHGKMLVPDEPFATMITEAFEGYAAGRFQTQTEVYRFLTGQPEWANGPSHRLTHRHIRKLLQRSIYAGYIEVAEWDIALLEGKHQPLISFATWKRAQERMKETAKAPAKKNINRDFPLRNFVVCGSCGEPLYGCWSKGRTKHYPYYLCVQKGCADYGKSIRRADLEGEFVALLRALRPSHALFAIMRDLLRDLWDKRNTVQRAQADAAETEIRKIEKTVDQFFDRIAQADDARLIDAYEKRIRELEERKLLLRENPRTSRPAQIQYLASFRTAMEFLANPYKLWETGRLEYRRMVLKLAFTERLAYLRGEGFRTAATSLPFSLLHGLEGGGGKMVGPAGLEPAT
ncbi:recombinase family protein [Stakelama tenebrarum]|uniref:Recombinase family protein n=1 Tax=Stakelama tenebrarum TaxID=2711215 RepID=A0A6G6Y550_9SPHN|nr:recombinase family protein [Sphingosinithalassobacter tenebrarum]QIG79927.1 recombinase family protein [Sphingosinithalassobacter tenebrarum]